MAVAFMAMLGSMILLPLYLQNVRGLSAAGDRAAGDARRAGDGSARPAGRHASTTRAARRVLVIPGAIGLLASLAPFVSIGSDDAELADPRSRTSC